MRRSAPSRCQRLMVSRRLRRAVEGCCCWAARKSHQWSMAIALADGRAVGTCDAATVDPRTLAIGLVKKANCADPTLYGQRVLALTYFSRHVASDGGAMLAVRIAHADAAARDGYTLGPVVNTYQQCSDCQAAVIYGDGSLWIYNPTAERVGRAAADLASNRGGRRAVGDAQNPARAADSQLERGLVIPVHRVRDPWRRPSIAARRL